MYRIWHFFIKKNRFSYLVMVALTGFGLLSVVLIPKESAPEVQIPIGVVTTILPGAPASDIETLVTNEIERSVTGAVENITSITSTSREGASSIVVEFDERADIDESIQELKDQIDLVKPDLPTDAEDPIVSEVNFVDQPIMMVAISGDLSDAALAELMDNLEIEIEGIQGVSRIQKNGVREREVTVVADQASLNRYRMSVNDVVSGLATANRVFPIGQIENDGVSYNIAFEGDIVDSSEIVDIPLVTRGGQPVYVRDVAVVNDSLSDELTISRLSLNGNLAINSASFDVYKQRGGDITRITSAVNTRLNELQEEGELLQDVNVLTILDAGADIKEDLIRLTGSGLTTVFLVIVVLILALGWREGFVAGSAIPLSFVIGFIGLYLSGNTINFVSLFSLILAIGILVDSAIVIVEGVNRRMKDDPTIDKKKAALDTIEEFGIPIMTGTLTTVSMFSGLFLVSGVTGQFIASIPFTINFILFASLLVALGFVPLIASTILRRRSATNFEQKQVAYARKLESAYRLKLVIFLRDTKKQNLYLSILMGLFFTTIFFPLNALGGVLIGFVSFAITYFTFKIKLTMWCAKLIKGAGWLVSILLSCGAAAAISIFLLPQMNLVKVIFFEQSDIDWIFAQVELPQGSLKEDTDIAMRRIEEILYEEEMIDSFVTTIGQAAAFGIDAGTSGEKFGNAFITLREDRTDTSTEVVERLRENLSYIRDVIVTVDQPSDGPPTGAELGFRFLGDDLVELTQVANEAAEMLKHIPGVTNVVTSTTNNSTEFVFTLDKQKTAALGLNPLVVSQTLRTAVFGTDATSLTTLDTDIDVVVKLDLTENGFATSDETNVTSLDTLKNIRLLTPSDETVLLSSLVTTSLRESSNAIAHDDGRRVVSISAGITGEGNIREINREFQKRLGEEFNLPNDITLEIGGETEESNQAFIEMLLALIVGVVLMLAVLVLQFNSFRHTIYVLSILPFSLIGIMIGLAITQLPLSFPSVMGFIALSGIVVNNSILLIDMMNNNRWRHPDKTMQENVLDAAASRLRPILLTTLTTVVGMIPLTYASDLWSPLAWAIMFGLSFSVVITLLLVPIIYSRWPGELT